MLRTLGFFLDFFLFDYSVYSWSRFNQEQRMFVQEETMTTSQDQDQKLDNFADLG